MSKPEKTTNAAYNSMKATPRGTHTIMGRTYQNEKELNHVMDEPTGKVYPGHGWPSLIAVFKIDYWLTRGIRVYDIRPNEGEKHQIIKKYQLQWDERKNRYTNSPEEIWKIAVKHHKDRLTEWAITSYGELQYRSTHR